MAALVTDPSTGPRPVTSLRARGSLLASSEAQLDALSRATVIDTKGREADFARSVEEAGHGSLRPARLEIFQINLGKLCNMTCRHCHVDAGPDRSDAMMSSETVDETLTALLRSGAHTVDITGGAPELHPRFRDIVERAVGAGLHVMDRCNLTVLLLPRFRDLPGWMAERGVEVVASLPHCRKLNTDAQRGDGAFDKSIAALRILNAVGYGQGDPRRTLTLMTNPAGAFLAGEQCAMEREWRRCLDKDYGVAFDRLIALNNMPISRFLEWLEGRGQLDSYLQMLVDGFNPAALDGLMCRNTVSVSWDGRVFDCDFNQMLDLDAEVGGRPMLHVRDLDAARFGDRVIRTARHCFGCTAGSGSSCGGATTAS
jgi:radical SAM/Cys-rich protein